MATRIGKYEIIRPIGKGAMGEVFLGKDPLLGRDVAIKTILTGGGFDEEAKASFEFEARATAALNHPNIVTVFDFGYQDGNAYLVMEYVEGDSLEALISNGTSKQTLIGVLADACEGLSYAHNEGLVHRDIKPGNVLVSMRGKKLYTKLVDFGVAQMDRGGHPGDGEWAGTIHYMAPEYLKTGKATASSDLFAVGVMLYEILSGGKKPFDGEDTTGVLSAILSQKPAPLTAINLGGLPTALLTVVKKALDKDPFNRYPDAESLGQAITNALRHAPVHTTAAIKPELMNVVVGKGQHATCLSLRVALRQVAAGGQITVLPGTYKESIVIDKDVVLVGEGDPTKVIIESTGPPAIRVKSGRSVVKLLTLVSTKEQIDSLVDVVEGQVTLRNCALKTLGNCAVNVEFGSEAALHDCVTVGHGTELLSIHGKAELNGGHYSGATRAAVSIINKGQGTFRNVQMGPGDGVGVMLEGSAKADLENVVFSGFDEGCLELNSNSVAQAKESVFLASKFAGLIQKGQSKTKMEGCQFKEHECSGVHIAHEAEVQLIDCRMSDNGGYGLSVLGGGDISLVSCEISRNAQTGAVVHRSGTVHFSQCRVLDGQTEGLHCFPNSEANLEFSEIKGNTKQGVQVDSSGYVAMKQCFIHNNTGVGINQEYTADVYLESCVIQQNGNGSIVFPQGGKRPTLMGNNHIDAFDDA